MKQSSIPHRKLCLFAALLVACPSLLAQQPATESAAPGTAMVPTQRISPEAQAILDRMTATLQGLKAYTITGTSSRDTVMAYGYKLQTNESATLTVQRPNRLRAEIRGDLRNRTIVYDGSTLSMYSPDDRAYMQVPAPDTLAVLISRLLDAGVELPLIDVLYTGATGQLTEAVRTGIVVGPSTINGKTCDQLAFRQANIDWQIWIAQGEYALPCKIVITTRHEVGDPQWQATLEWNLKPTIQKSAFEFKAPEGSVQIPFAGAALISEQNQ
jgi:hypothetical protein